MKKTVTTISSVALLAMLATLSTPADAANESTGKNPQLRQKAQELHAKQKSDRKALEQAEAELKVKNTQEAREKVDAAKAQLKADRKERRALRKEARGKRGHFTEEQRIRWQQQRAEVRPANDMPAEGLIPMSPGNARR